MRLYGDSRRFRVSRVTAMLQNSLNTLAFGLERTHSQRVFFRLSSNSSSVKCSARMIYRPGVIIIPMKRGSKRTPLKRTGKFIVVLRRVGTRCSRQCVAAKKWVLLWCTIGEA